MGSEMCIRDRLQVQGLLQMNAAVSIFLGLLATKPILYWAPLAMQVSYCASGLCQKACVTEVLLRGETFELVLGRRSTEKTNYTNLKPF